MTLSTGLLSQVWVVTYSKQGGGLEPEKDFTVRPAGESWRVDMKLERKLSRRMVSGIQQHNNGRQPRDGASVAIAVQGVAVNATGARRPNKVLVEYTTRTHDSSSYYCVYLQQYK